MVSSWSPPIQSAQSLFQHPATPSSASSPVNSAIRILHVPSLCVLDNLIAAVRLASKVLLLCFEGARAARGIRDLQKPWPQISVGIMSTLKHVLVLALAYKQC